MALRGPRWRLPAPRRPDPPRARSPECPSPAEPFKLSARPRANALAWPGLGTPGHAWPGPCSPAPGLNSLFSPPGPPSRRFCSSGEKVLPTASLIKKRYWLIIDSAVFRVLELYYLRCAERYRTWFITDRQGGVVSPIPVQPHCGSMPIAGMGDPPCPEARPLGPPFDGPSAR